MSAKHDQNQSRCADYLDAIDRSAGNNRDSQGIGVIRIGRSAVGFVQEISGEEGQECPEFVVTRHELLQLAHFWMSERMNHDFDWFVCQCTGSPEWRRSVYVGRRLDRLTNVLGGRKMQQLWEECVARFRRERSLSEEDWRIFQSGTDAEQEAWRRAVRLDMQDPEPSPAPRE
jgi:hypothetical protein